jgi:hypothetical protein
MRQYDLDPDSRREELDAGRGNFLIVANTYPDVIQAILSYRKNRHGAASDQQG